MALNLLGSNQLFESNKTRGIGTECVGTKCVGTKLLRLEYATKFYKWRNIEYYDFSYH